MNFGSILYFYKIIALISIVYSSFNLANSLAMLSASESLPEVGAEAWAAALLPPPLPPVTSVTALIHELAVRPLLTSDCNIRTYMWKNFYTFLQKNKNTWNTKLLALFPGPPTVQFLIAYSMQQSKTGRWEDLGQRLPAIAPKASLTPGTWQRQTSLPLSPSTLNNMAAVFGASDLNCFRAPSRA